MRIGFLLDDFEVQAWAYEAIKKAIEIKSVVPCVLILKNKESTKAATKTRLRRLLDGDVTFKTLTRFLYYRYAIWDKKRYVKPERDAHALKDVREFLHLTPVVEVNPRETRYCDWIEGNDLEVIKNYKPDILLRFGFRILKGPILELPTYGIWSYHHGDPEKYRGGPSGFWETYNNEGVVGAVLQRLSDKLDAGQMLARVVIPASKESPAITQNDIAWDSSPLLHLCLNKLVMTGDPVLNKKVKILTNGPIYSTPGLLATLLMITKYIWRKLKEPSRFYVQHWSIQISPARQENNSMLLYKRDFKTLKQPKGKFRADPFLACVDNKDYLFFEEYDYSTNKGIIKMGEIGSYGFLNEPIAILEDDNHLSNPFVFYENGTLYLLPEQAQSGEVSLYRCVEFPMQWEKCAVLLKDGYYVDPLLFKKDDKWWLFCVERLSNKGSSTTYAKLWYAECLEGPWQEHPSNPISTDCRYSRSGGSIIQKNNQIVRVVQDCSKGYGYQINYLRVKHLSETDFEEELIGAISPQRLGVDGIHTINMGRTLTVIDSRKKTFRYRI